MQGFNVVHLVVESGVPAGMPVLNIPITVHYAAVDRFWDGRVVYVLLVALRVPLRFVQEGLQALGGVPALQDLSARYAPRGEA